MFRHMLLCAVVLAMSVLSNTAYAGGLFFRGRSCRGVVATNFVSSQIIANKVVDVQFTPSFVSFVPSQVLLNSQVTTYGSPQSFSYSYQGGYQQAQPQQQVDSQAYQQQMQQMQQAQPLTQPSGQPLTLDQRMERMEKLLLKVLGDDQPQAAVDSHQVIAQTFLIQSCKKCHEPGGKGAKDLIMFDSTGQLLDKLPRFDVYDSITAGRMPQGAPKVEDQRTLEGLRLWVQDGLKNLKY